MKIYMYIYITAETYMVGTGYLHIYLEQQLLNKRVNKIKRMYFADNFKIQR